MLDPDAAQVEADKLAQHIIGRTILGERLPPREIVLTNTERMMTYPCIWRAKTEGGLGAVILLWWPGWLAVYEQVSGDAPNEWRVPIANQTEFVTNAEMVTALAPHFKIAGEVAGPNPEILIVEPDEPLGEAAKFSLA